MRGLSLLALLVALPACAQDSKDLHKPLPALAVVPYRGGAVDYEKQVVPILENKCLTCHSGSIKKGRYDMSNLEGVLRGGKSGAAVVAAKPEQSLLLKLAGRTGTPPMPPADDEPLTPEELALLKAWVAQGARGPAVATVKSATALKASRLPESVKPVLAVGVSPDKKLVAAGRGATIHLYSADKGELARTLLDPGLKDEHGKPIAQSQLDLVNALAFSKDGQHLYSGGFREVIIWNVSTGAVVKRFTEFADRVVALDVSPDGRWIAAAGGAPTQDGEVKVIDLTTGQCVLTLKAPHSDTVFGVRFSPDGSMLATAGADKFVKVWAVKPILRPELPITAVAVSLPLPAMAVPGVGLGRQLTSLSRLQQVEWTVIQPGAPLKSFEGHTHHVMDVAWKADGKLLVSAGADNVLKVWDFDKGEQARTIAGHSKQISRLATFATGSMVISACGDAGLRQWNLDNGGNVRSFPGNSGFLYAVAAAGDGSLVAAGGEEGVVRLYNGQNGALLKTLAPTPEKKK